MTVLKHSVYTGFGGTDALLTDGGTAVSSIDE